MSALVAWYALGWMTLGLFCRYSDLDELKLCDVLFVVVTGPCMLLLWVVALPLLIGLLASDAGLSRLCRRLPRFSCPVIWKRDNRRRGSGHE